MRGGYTVYQFLSGPAGLQPNTYPTQVYMTCEEENQAKFSIFRDTDVTLCRDAIGGEPWTVQSEGPAEGKLVVVTLVRGNQTLVLKARPGMQY